VIASDGIQDHLHQVIRFRLCHIVDLFNVQSNSINGVKAGDRIRPYDRMCRIEDLQSVRFESLATLSEFIGWPLGSVQRSKPPVSSARMNLSCELVEMVKVRR
jgi:hypothetical protein